MATAPPASQDVIPVTMLSGFLGAGEWRRNGESVKAYTLSCFFFFAARTRSMEIGSACLTRARHTRASPA